MFQTNNSQESSENEEVYLLSEEDHDEEPSEEQILNYIIFLGFEITHDEEFKEIAKKALMKPLPIGWKRAFLKNSNRMCYFDTVSQNFHQYTPGDETAIKDFDALKKMKQHAPLGRGKNLPPLGNEGKGNKKKAPPLNPLRELHNNEEKNNFQEKEFESDIHSFNSNNNIASKNPEIQEKNELNTSLNKGIKKEVEMQTVIQKEDSKKDLNSFNKSYSNKNKYSDLNKSLNNSREKESKKNDSFERKETSVKQQLNEKNNNVKEENEKEMIKATIPSNQIVQNEKNENVNKSSVTNTVNNSPSVKANNKGRKEKNRNNVDNTAEKMKYYESKLKELKNFEEQEKEKYENKRKEYKERKSHLKETFQNKCENELITEFYKLEKEHNAEEYARLLESELIGEIEQYKELMESKKNRELRKESQVQDNRIYTLKEEIKAVLTEIAVLSKPDEERENDFDSVNAEIQETKKLLDEKYLIEVKSIEMNYEAMQKQIEYEEESRFRNEIAEIKISIKNSQENKEKSFKSHYIKILEEYKNALEIDFALQCKNLQREYECCFDRDIEAYRKELDLQLDENGKMMKESFKEIEKEYNEEISKIRYVSKLESNERDKAINDNFEAAAHMYDVIKKAMNEKINDIGNLFLEQLDTFIKNSDNIFDEFLLNNLDKHNIETQKKKNNYELFELEYKTKSVLLEYLLEVGGELMALLSENSINITSDLEKDDFLYDHILKIVRMRQQKYKQKLIKWKDTKLFNIIDSFKETIKPIQFATFKSRNSYDSVPNLKTSFDINKSKVPVFTRKKSFDNKRYNDTTNMIDVTSSQNALSFSTSKYNNLIGSIAMGNKEFDIIARLNSLTKDTIDKINSFINEEKTTFQKEEINITNDKVIHENFKDALRKSNYCLKSNLNETTFSSSKKAKNFLDMVNFDNNKILRNSEKLEKRKIMFERIVGLYNDFSCFVQENVRDPDDNTLQNFLSEKLNKVVSYIEEYRELFYKNYEIDKFTTPSQEYINTSIYLKENNMQRASQSINLKGCQTNPNKSFVDNYYSLIQENPVNNSFNNFIQFYGKNSLHKDFKRKNKSNLNHRSEYLNFSFN